MYSQATVEHEDAVATLKSHFPEGKYCSRCSSQPLYIVASSISPKGESQSWASSAPEASGNLNKTRVSQQVSVQESDGVETSQRSKSYRQDLKQSRRTAVSEYLMNQSRSLQGLPLESTSAINATGSSSVPKSYPVQSSPMDTEVPYPSNQRLNTDARRPTTGSDQGMWLEVGTMRGPTPSGVRMIDEIVGKSFSKNGQAEKGMKEIRKILKHENRTVVEWVQEYLRTKWRLEL